MNKHLLDRIVKGDCCQLIARLDDASIDLFLSDIPYGISLAQWDILHNNTNSALLGSSPAQKGKSGFKRRGKPINGWSQADRMIGIEYQEWCSSWAEKLFPKMKTGSFLMVFSARRTLHHLINAFENCGFLLRDVLCWKKPVAHHRAQRVSTVFARRGDSKSAQKWQGWRLGNLAPVWEPIAWFVKPYKIGGTITDNLLKNEVGAINVAGSLNSGKSPTNLLEFSFAEDEKRVHEAQKPQALLEYLIKLVTCENQTVLDPFVGSGTTAVAAKKSKRKFIAFEIEQEYVNMARQRLKQVK